MRNPRGQLIGWLLCLIAGVLCLSAIALWPEALGGGAMMVIGLAGGMAITLGITYGLVAWLIARREARLRRGEGVLARWRVTPEDWEAFRVRDAKRGQQDPGLRNDFRPRPGATCDVEVLFGRDMAIVDGVCLPLRGIRVQQVLGVSWDAPGDAPDCLEIGLAYPLGKGGTLFRTLRVPVPAEARAEGRKVFDHVSTLVPKPDDARVLRLPWLVVGRGFGALLAALAVAGIGEWLRARGLGGEAGTVLATLGGIAAIAATIFIAIMLLVAPPWRGASSHAASQPRRDSPGPAASPGRAAERPSRDRSTGRSAGTDRSA